MSMAERYIEAGCLETPRPIAEALPDHVAVAALRNYETRQSPEGLFHSAWCYTEYALNNSPHIHEVSRKYHLETAQTLLGWSINDPVTHEDIRLGSMVLSSYLPLFKKRCFRESITSDDCRELYVSLGAAVDFLHPIEADYPPPWRMTELALLSMAARTFRPELLLYPASPREEASTVPELNHDSYFLTRGSKLPIQQKLCATEHKYDDWITILTLEPLLEAAYRKSGLEMPDDPSNRLNELLELVVRESHHDSLSTKQKIYLDTLSAAIAQYYFQARAKNSESI